MPLIGFGGAPFTLFKFRTMRDVPGLDDSPLSDEKRLTRFGRLLRAASLDELLRLVEQGRAREQREHFAKDWVHVPHEKFKEWFVEWELRGEKSIPNYPPSDATNEIVDWQERMHYIDDSTGMCAGLSSFPYKPPFHIHNLPDLISAGAGLDLDKPSLEHLTRRNRNLVRANNLRRGMTRKDEARPEDHWKRRFP